MKLLNGIRLFFQGAFDFERKSTGIIENTYEQELEEFMILCFSDLLGIDLPTGYYALEIYPFLADEIERWQKNSNDRASIWETMWSQLEMDP